MITIINDPTTCPEMGGIDMPVIVCDACGQRVTEHGNAYWVQLPSGDYFPQVWHTHKHPCSELDKVIERQYGGVVLFEELDRHLEHVAHNFRNAADGVTS